MNRFTIKLDKLNYDVLKRLCCFFNEASQMEGVTVDGETLSLIFENEKEETKLHALADKHGIVDLTYK